MRKIYLFLSLLFCTTAFAQEERALNEIERSKYKTAIDFTVTDINGKTHNLYEYLDQGKFVVLDFFSTWCDPCWDYHETEALEKLYEEKGEGGSGEFIILAIESDIKTTIDQLNGIGDQTKGNWIEGTLYPICDISETNCPDVANNYRIEGYPTILMVAPNQKREYVEIGTLSNIEDFEQVAEDFILDDEAPEVDFSEVPGMLKGTEITFTNLTEGLVDSYKWTFEGGTPATSTDKDPKVKFEEKGTFNISLEATNANGSNKVTKQINILNVEDYDPYIENFENISAFTEDYVHWKSLDIDKKKTTPFYNMDHPGEGEASGFIIFDPDKVSGFLYKAKEGKAMGFVMPPSNYSPANDWIISPKLKIEKSMVFKFWAQTPRVDAGASKFTVCVSTTDDDPESFVKISKGDYLEGTAVWKEYVFNLSAYEGKEIHVAINNISSKSYCFLIDDLRVVFDPNSGTDEIRNKTKIFPVPSNNMVYVSSEFEFTGYKIYNQLGQLVLQQTSNAKAFNINVSELEKGVYFIHLNGEKGNINKKIIIE